MFVAVTVVLQDAWWWWWWFACFVCTVFALMLKLRGSGGAEEMFIRVDAGIPSENLRQKLAWVLCCPPSRGHEIRKFLSCMTSLMNISHGKWGKTTLNLSQFFCTFGARAPPQFRNKETNTPRIRADFVWLPPVLGVALGIGTFA